MSITSYLFDRNKLKITLIERLGPGTKTKYKSKVEPFKIKHWGKNHGRILNKTKPWYRRQ